MVEATCFVSANHGYDGGVCSAAPRGAGSESQGFRGSGRPFAGRTRPLKPISIVLTKSSQLDLSRRDSDHRQYCVSVFFQKMERSTSHKTHTVCVKDSSVMGGLFYHSCDRPTHKALSLTGTFGRDVLGPLAGDFILSFSTSN